MPANAGWRNRRGPLNHITDSGDVRLGSASRGRDPSNELRYTTINRRRGLALPDSTSNGDSETSDKPSDYDSRRPQTERDVLRRRNPSNLR
jgi:hypothetical protein